ncbi:hypothetical protein CEXT_598171 [Caerostris extrusa]|uniref:Uncharacterized protein n=1 Tax=Caerostris extrusa TaxID=172846 RepID=A0AAV4SS59_CAEEX|nr:hypothetical protein CEXT_598171 [Caerostris extrusa]
MQMRTSACPGLNVSGTVVFHRFYRSEKSSARLARVNTKVMPWQQGNRNDVLQEERESAWNTQDRLARVARLLCMAAVEDKQTRWNVKLKWTRRLQHA